MSKGQPVRIRVFPAILRRLGRMGMRLEPFFTVREGEFQQPLKTADSDFRFSFVDEDEFETVVEFERTVDRQTLRSWLDEGRRCFAVWDGPRMVASMWCDFQEYSFAPNYRLLDVDEVYLFAAYAHPDYRGHNIAPQMRLRCYEALREMGKSRFYSYTDYFNVAARRFKEKLGARNELLRLHIRLVDRWSRTFTLRQY